jgi:histone acetyltransferase (RNA polymerase elongator complex component)
LFKHYTIPIFIPELACPFQCVFCNQEKITGKELIPCDEDIIGTIESHLDTFRKKDRIVEIGFFGGSFTGIDTDSLVHYLELVQPFLTDGSVKGIRVSTRPDYIDDNILSVLKSLNVSAIELGAQSMSNAVLKASRRGHTVEQTELASRAIRSKGFELGLQMMIGLPGDNLKRAVETGKKIIELKAETTRIYPTLVIKSTGLHQWFLDGKYTPLSLDEAVEWTARILPLFEEAGVKILRVGLHPSEGLLTGEELIAGPFHPSFRELVLTQIWKEQLEPLLDQHTGSVLDLFVPPGEINYAIGHQSTNRKMLERHFHIVTFQVDGNLKAREFNSIIN